jgi:AcrR family transcriptional regulator
VLFVAQGYGATSVAQIADQAGVALKTVYLAFPTKVDLLDKVIGVSLAGDDRPQPLRTRDWFQETLQAPPDRLLVLFAERTADLMARAAQVLLVAEAAADSDAAVRRRRAIARRSRRADIRLVAGALARKVPGLGEAEATDIMYTLAAAQNYAQLVLECGWSRARYLAWLSRTLQLVLLEPAS